MEHKLLILIWSAQSISQKEVSLKGVSGNIVRVRERQEEGSVYEITMSEIPLDNNYFGEINWGVCSSWHWGLRWWLHIILLMTRKVIKILSKRNLSTVKVLWDKIPDSKGYEEPEMMDQTFCQVSGITTVPMHVYKMLG